MVITLWAIVVALIVPFYMFSQKELAPMEDQGFIFGIIQGAANSTIDQTKLFADQVDDAYRSIPEASSTFQVIFPNFGFSGLVTKPWNDRSRGIQEIQMDSPGRPPPSPGSVPSRYSARAARRR